MKKINFVLFVILSVMFVSCQAKYKEVTLEDGTVVYTLESDNVDSAQVKRIANKSLTAVENIVDEALTAPAEYKKFEDDVKAQQDATRARMDAFEKKYFSDLYE